MHLRVGLSWDHFSRLDELTLKDFLLSVSNLHYNSLG